MNSTSTIVAGVSFARTPLNEISAKTEEVRALGWEESGRGDPWAVSYRKDFPEGEESDAELQAAMGEYWVSKDEIRALLDSNS